MLNLRGVWRFRLMFPELSDAEFQTLMHYAQGASVHCIADIMKSSLPAVKQSLQRTRSKLNLEKLESARGVYNARMQVAMLATDDFPAHFHETMQKQLKDREFKNATT
jgi:DNA-binding NarL/FixJ family response regulator